MVYMDMVMVMNGYGYGYGYDGLVYSFDMNYYDDDDGSDYDMRLYCTCHVRSTVMIQVRK